MSGYVIANIDVKNPEAYKEYIDKVKPIVEKFGGSVHSWPLSAYRDQPFYSLRTDALDRFGTKLEKRFTKLEIEAMMENSGLEKIKFSRHTPFYCAVGLKK